MGDQPSHVREERRHDAARAERDDLARERQRQVGDVRLAATAPTTC
jgi:hypothetical protein